MAWKRGWFKTKQKNGFMIYTYKGGYSNYTLNDFALFNKGAVSLNCYVRDCEDIDEHSARRTLSEYFRAYGKRIVVVEKHGSRKGNGCLVEIHFLHPELPTDEEIGTWFTEINAKVHE